MSRERQYSSSAEKQAAYRHRQTQRQDRLRGLLYRLEEAVWDAVDAGDELAKSCAATSYEGILRRLAEVFEQRAAQPTQTVDDLPTEPAEPNNIR